MTFTDEYMFDDFPATILSTILEPGDRSWQNQFLNTHRATALNFWLSLLEPKSDTRPKNQRRGGGECQSARPLPATLCGLFEPHYQELQGHSRVFVPFALLEPYMTYYYVMIWYKYFGTEKFSLSMTSSNNFSGRKMLSVQSMGKQHCIRANHQSFRKVGRMTSNT